MKRNGLLILMLALVNFVFGQDKNNYFELGQKEYNAKNYSGAINYFSKAIIVKPTASEYWFRAASYGCLNQFQKAIEDFTEAMTYYSENEILVQLYTNRGFYKSKTKDYEGAVADYNKAISLGGDKVSYYSRGMFYYLTVGDVELARSDFKKAIELDGDSTWVSAQMECLLGNRGKGYGIQARLIETTHDKVEYYNMARLRALMGEETEALRYLELALKKGFDNYRFIISDDDLINIKYKPAFKKLMDTYNLPYDVKIEGVSDVIKNYVAGELEKWQKKGEFEKTADYLVRVSDENRKKRIALWQQEKMDELSKAEIAFYGINYFTISDYDADNETYLLKGADRNYIIKVPISVAPSFKKNFNAGMVSGQKFILTDDGFKLSEFTITVASGTYHWSHNNDNPYQQTDINYNFDKAEINLPTAKEDVKQSISKKQITIGKSDVDVEIPVGRAKNNAYVLIIGNEDYSSFQTNLSNEVNVDYAVNDAEVFKNYCVKTLGIPSAQIKFLKNATAAQIKQGLAWISNLAQVDNGKAELVFYYSGHGLPDEQSKEPYIIPVDVSADNITDGVKLNDVYSKLTQYPSKRITCFIDACFSGGARNVGLRAEKGIKIKPKETNISDNMIVLASSTGDESSGVYREKQHGYMTYYLLKKLQETSGDVSYGQLSSYVIENVRKSTALSGKIQTPQIMAGSAVGDLTAIKLK